MTIFLRQMTNDGGYPMMPPSIKAESQRQTDKVYEKSYYLQTAEQSTYVTQSTSSGTIQ